MKNSNGGKDAGLKKPYRKPTVESRGLKLGVYGDYGSNDDNHGGTHDHHGGGRGDHRGGHRRGHGF